MRTVIQPLAQDSPATLSRFILILISNAFKLNLRETRAVSNVAPFRLNPLNEVESSCFTTFSPLDEYEMTGLNFVRKRLRLGALLLSRGWRWYMNTTMHTFRIWRSIYLIGRNMYILITISSREGLLWIVYHPPVLPQFRAWKSFHPAQELQIGISNYIVSHWFRYTCIHITSIKISLHNYHTLQKIKLPSKITPLPLFDLQVLAQVFLQAPPFIYSLSSLLVSSFCQISWPSIELHSKSSLMVAMALHIGLGYYCATWL